MAPSRTIDDLSLPPPALTGEDVVVSRLVEIRRHSTARRSEERRAGSALSPRGVSLARRVGEGFRKFDLVVTSDIARATETAIAMGLAIDEIDDTLAPHDPSFWAEAEKFGGGRRLTFAVWAEIAGQRGAVWRHGERQRDRWLEIASAVPEAGSALIISHGGTIECGVVASFGSGVWSAWEELSPCDGVQLTVEGATLVSAIMIRADAAGVTPDERTGADPGRSRPLGCGHGVHSERHVHDGRPSTAR
jgi:broad specificity phosphatase PhoE